MASVAPVAQAPEAPDLSTTLGAGVPRDGVPFTRDSEHIGEEGHFEYHLTREGGHSHRRIIHAADRPYPPDLMADVASVGGNDTDRLVLWCGLAVEFAKEGVSRLQTTDEQQRFS